MNTSQDYFLTIQLFNKDIKELNFWMTNLEDLTTTLNQLGGIERQLVKSSAINYALLTFRRKNTLLMASLFRQQQRVSKEKEYGSEVYNLKWSREQDYHRTLFTKHLNEFKALQNSIYEKLILLERL